MINLSCRKVSELSSKRLDEQLTFSETLKMYWHTLLCVFCSQFRTQIEHLRKLFRSEDLLAETGEGMSQEARQKLVETVRAKIAGD